MISWLLLISITISITADELTRSTRSIEGNPSYITISCSGSCGSVGRAAFFCQPLLHLKNGCNKWQVQTGNDCLLSLKKMKQHKFKTTIRGREACSDSNQDLISNVLVSWSIEMSVLMVYQDIFFHLNFPPFLQVSLLLNLQETSCNSFLLHYYCISDPQYK